MKAGLRRQLLDRRAALSPEERRRQSRAIGDRLRSLPLARGAATLAGYYPLAAEVDVLEFLEEAIVHGRRVALPRVDGRELSFHLWQPGDPLERNVYRILEPLRSAPSVPHANLDVFLVPGIGFDRNGHRLGYGQGFYDRLLAQVPREVRVGVAFDLQVVASLPSDPHDVPLGWLVTPNELIRFRDH